MSDTGTEGAGVALIEDLVDSDNSQEISSTKRKRTDGGQPANAKSKKRRKLRKPKDVNDDALDAELGVNHAIAHMDSRLIADHVAQRTKRFQPELSLVEVEDKYIPEKAVRDTSSYSQPRTSDHLSDFLEQFVGSKRKKKLAATVPEKGHPHTLIVAGAGLRAADLARAVRKYQTKDALVAKLFAKHIKLKEAVEMVKRSRINIGVGTPQRVIDLLEDGALSAAHLERIVIDASHIDQKKRGILDMKETLIPLVELLARKGFKERYGIDGAQRLELLFF